MSKLFDKACRACIIVLDVLGAVILFLLFYATIFLDWNL